MSVPRSSPAANRVLGRNIARLRQASGLTQDGLAERLSVTPRYLRKIESGMHAPSVPVLLAARKALKAGWEEIFGGL